MKAIRESEWFGGRRPRSRLSPHADLGSGSVARCGSSSPAPPRSPLPALEALAGSPPRAGRRRHPARRPGRPRPQARRRRPVARARRGARRTGAQARAPARPRVPGRAARAGARLLPGRRLRRAAARSRRSTSRAHGWVNLHFSVLPAWRGAAPVQHAILAGDEVTGATTFRIVEGLDAGPTFGVMTETIRPDDTAGDLLRPARRGRRRAAGRDPRRHRGRHARGACRSRPRASRSRPRSPSRTPGSTGTEPALAVDRRVRACTPGPGRLDDVRRRAAQARPGDARRRRRPPRRPGELDGRPRTPSTSAPAPAPVRLGDGPGARQEADGRRRLGPRRPARRTESGSAMTDRRPAPTGRPRRRTAAAPGRSGPAPPTRPGWRRTTCCAPSPTDAYANLCCRRLLRAKRTRRARRRRSPPSWPTARMRGAAASTTRSSPRPPAGRSTQIDADVLDALRLGAHQLLGMRVAVHAAVDKTVGPARGWSRRRCQRLRQRRAAPGQRARPRRLGRAGRARPATRSPAWRSLHSHPRVGRAGAARGAARPRRVHRRDGRRRARGPAGRRQRARRGHPGRPARAWPTSTSSSRPAPARSAAARRSARCSTAATPAAIAAVRDGRAGVQDEGSQLCRRAGAAPTSRPVDGPRRRWLDLCAGPGGKAALLARWPRRRGAPAARQRGQRAPAPSWSARRSAAPIDAGIEVVVGTGDGRGRRRTSRRPSTGCWSTRRAPGWARCAAGPRRAGATPADLADLGRCSARCSPRRSTRSGPAASSPTSTCSPAPRRDPVVVGDVLEQRDDVERAGRPAAVHRRAGRAGPHLGDGPVRPAVAAPARHRRDVPAPCCARG